MKKYVPVGSPRGHLQSIESRMGRYARTRDWRSLEAYLRSDEFVVSISALDADMRVRAMLAVTNAQTRCAPKMPFIPAPGTTAPFSIKDPANERRLRDAWAKTGTDKGLAAMLGIPLPAAKSARWKVIGPLKPKSTGAAATQALRA